MPPLGARSSAASVVTAALALSVLGCPKPSGDAAPSASAAASSSAFASAPKLAKGDAAPAFSLDGSDGKRHALADDAGKRVVVVAWFPKAFTGG
ncbi:MAG TPA: hypothetical protein VGM56_31620 [Byssovorax sp.]|jgi:hypothetical protein